MGSEGGSKSSAQISARMAGRGCPIYMQKAHVAVRRGECQGNDGHSFGHVELRIWAGEMYLRGLTRKESCGIESEEDKTLANPHGEGVRGRRDSAKETE